MTAEQLAQVAEDAKSLIRKATSRKAGHMASSFGVARLTVAVHARLKTPDDVLIWDVGHQAYVHKVLTGRADEFHLNRTPEGPSGFPKRAESEHDAFGAGHSSTSISALMGFARADQLQGVERHRVAVIGDGAFTGGMVYEAMNDAGNRGDDVLVILNDNGLAIEENTGALHAHKRYQTLAESMGWHYCGDVSDVDMGALLDAIDTALSSSGPRLLRVTTTRPTEAELGASGTVDEQSFQKGFARALREMASEDERIVALTAAMAPGCSLTDFRDEFPERFFDVGIAEPHAVTTAAGMACAGLKPIINLYSTFSQRAVDQWIHDVALQKLPVILCLDRAGIVGEDGATHHGVFDLAIFRSIPETAVWTPYDERSLRDAMRHAAQYGGPSVIRYPKGLMPNVPEPEVEGMQVDVFRHGTGVMHWCIGPVVKEVLDQVDPGDSVVALRMVKPLPQAMMARMARNHYQWTVWEDGQVINGIGSALASWVAETGQSGLTVYRKGYPDKFIGHGPQEALIQAHRR